MFYQNLVNSMKAYRINPPLVGGAVEQMLKTNKYKSRGVWPGRGREEKDALNSNPRGLTQKEDISCLSDMDNK